MGKAQEHIHRIHLNKPHKEGNKNTQRRIQPTRKVVDSPGDARPDWWVFVELAKRLSHNMSFRDTVVEMDLEDMRREDLEPYEEVE